MGQQLFYAIARGERQGIKRLSIDVPEGDTGIAPTS
jgi:hypothetical protein